MGSARLASPEPVSIDLERLIDRFRGPLVGLMASFGAPWGEATDLAQDVFAEAYLARERFAGSFDDDQAVGRWLRGIARNLYRASARSKERRRSEELDEALHAGAPAPGEVSNTAQREALEAALAALAPEQRTAVQMVYLEQSSLRAVAGLLGVTEKTVEGRLYRARRELRRRLSAVTTPDRPGGQA